MMTKVMIVGDTHGHDKTVSNINKAARIHDVDTIVQLGDFGYNFDPNLLASIRAWLDQDDGRKWYWLDGNHDHHEYIAESILPGADRSKPVPHFHDRMFYCPRGSVVTIGEKRCMFLGGAYSIDVNYRTPYISWWPQEMITYADVERCIENGSFGHPDGSIDVMFTHDTPPTEWIVEKLEASGYKSDASSSHNRKLLGFAVDHVRPNEIYHGHYHWRYSDIPYVTNDGWKVAVHGVAANVATSIGGQWIDPEAIEDHNYVLRTW